MHSYLEASARQRVAALLDADSFVEFLPPQQSEPSAHLAALGIPGAFDDGVVIGAGRMDGRRVLVVAQEGRFMGGAVGETHGAKICGLLARAARDQPDAVLLLTDSGGVRLHEANAGLIAISEIMRAMLATRAAGVPVIGVVGGSCGAFGGMGIVTSLCSALIMTEDGRLALSGPEVIETVKGVEEFDSRDRALVWRVTGGKHRFLMRDCSALADDDVHDLRRCVIETLAAWRDPAPGLAQLEVRQQQLQERLRCFSGMNDGTQVWRAMGLKQPERVALMEPEDLGALREEFA